MSATEGLSPDAQRLLDALLAEREAGATGSEPTRIPLSGAQERLWELGKLAAGSAWGNLPLVFRVRGPLDLDALETALGDLLARHATLRTRYEEADGRVMGKVGDPPAPALEREAVEDEEAALARIREEAARPLDPTRDPAFRARWLSAADTDGWLFLLTHHLAADGWSLGLLLRELSACYAARAQGKEPALDPIAASFARVAQSERAARPPDEAALAYWEDRLAGAPREVPLPGSTRAAGPGDYESRVVAGRLDPAESAAFRRLAAEAGVTPFAAWLALLGAILAAYTEEADIVVGTTVSNRASADREALIANFGNNLLLRTRVDADRPFTEILRGVRETLPRDLAYQGVTLEALLRRVTRLPRLNVLYMLRDGSPDDHLSLDGCEAAYLSVEAGASTLDLSVDVQDRGEDGFVFSIEHRLIRVPAEEGERLARDLAQAARAVTRTPGLSCGDLPIERGCWASDREVATSPEPAAPPGTTEPLTEAEAALADLWREALDLEEIGPYDNFFELGGHSLLAIDLLERIEVGTGVRLTPVDLVSQTLGQLAAALEEGAGPEASSDSKVSVEAGRRGWLGRLRGARGAS